MVREKQNKVFEKLKHYEAEENAKIYIASIIARDESVDIDSTDVSTLYKMADSVKLPDFTLEETDISDETSANKKIAYYVRQGKTTREIADILGKTYVRVKNVVKKMRES